MESKRLPSWLTRGAEGLGPGGSRAARTWVARASSCPRGTATRRHRTRAPAITGLGVASNGDGSGLGERGAGSARRQRSSYGRCRKEHRTATKHGGDVARKKAQGDAVPRKPRVDELRFGGTFWGGRRARQIRA
ncbi:hypothetical protein NL676_013122 [Syzygium grande]|nr:hypothetical protein NL676_013122 [Syzygium grande]